MTYGSGWFDATRKFGKMPKTGRTEKEALGADNNVAQCVRLLQSTTLLTPHPRSPAPAAEYKEANRRVRACCAGDRDASRSARPAAPCAPLSPGDAVFPAPQANNGKERKDLYTDNWDGSEYKGSQFNILNLLVVLFIGVPVLGLVFAYQTYGTLWG